MFNANFSSISAVVWRYRQQSFLNFYYGAIVVVTVW